ncbi:uncharacterized protein LOC127789744 isoform X2 [Diospyros lotus]|uniref:uncharacterized protein LOC127789744 isoform X2 n=1 Tax=Diospyros lotus TaxID=55363 RepID=UPI00224D86AF|nr:uncharacterized protein LOC127789744 isoform X2 [Diospyros lotus]
MYADSELMFPYFETFSLQEQDLEESCCSNSSNVSVGNLVQTSTISEYDLGAEGDLFKAPEPIIEEPVVGFDPISASITIISCGEDGISPQTLEFADIDSIQTEQLLSEVFYECKKDLLAKDAIDTPLSELLDFKIPVVGTDEHQIAEDKFIPEGSFQKSVSSGCLTSMEWINGAPMRPNFLDFPGMDLNAVYGIRRAFSEGDIKTLGNHNVNLIQSSVGLPQFVSNCNAEDRRQKLSRYRNKKTKRNFGRKIKGRLPVHLYFIMTASFWDFASSIKYACRKALADSQPRIRGRFAKTE